LPEEKQQRILNAALEVFGTSDFKHASTEDIASKAGISKGLLFYYFQNKRALYTFLFDWAADLVTRSTVSDDAEAITDFFDFFAQAAERKCRMLSHNPYIMEFFVRAFYSKNEAISEDIAKKIERETQVIFAKYFSHIDLSKFRDDINPKEIFQALTWMTDGYIHERQNTGQPIDIGEIMEKFKLWSNWFRKISYKGEYQS